MVSYSELNTESQSTIRHYQVVVAVVALVAELFLAGDWYGFAAVIPFVSQSLHLSAAEAGFAQGIFTITYAASLLAWGPLSDRFEAKRMIVGGLFGTGLFMFLQGFSHSYGELLAARALIGIFDAAIFVGTMKLIAHWFPPARRGSLMGSLLAAYSLAITGDFAVGIPVAHQFGWNVFLSGLGVLTLLMGVVAAAIIRSKPADVGIGDFLWERGGPADEAHATSIADIFRRPWIYIAALAIFGDTFAIGAGATWVIPMFLTVHHISFGLASLVGSIMGLSQVLFLFVGGYFSDRVRKRVMPMRIGAALATLSALLFTLSALTQMSVGVLILFAAISGVAVFSGGAIFSLVADRYGEALAGTAVGYAEIGGIISTFVAPAVMGWLITNTHGFGDAFWLFTGVEFVIFAILLFVRDDAKSVRTAQP
jgi:MFS family permease